MRQSGISATVPPMPIDPESLYRQLGQLIAETPERLAGPGPITPEMHRWLGRASALVEVDGSLPDRVGFNSASNYLNGPNRELNAHQIVTMLHRALARAELKAPAAVQGAFIPVGASFDVLQAIAKVLRGASRDVLIVDAYMDAKALTDFAPLAAPNCFSKTDRTICSIVARLRSVAIHHSP